jgi:hypothetical protein
MYKAHNNISHLTEESDVVSATLEAKYVEVTVPEVLELDNRIYVISVNFC